MPRVTTSAVAAPRRSIAALIAIVEPWMKSDASASGTAAFRRQAASRGAPFSNHRGRS